jgi:hypothetical protein
MPCSSPTSPTALFLSPSPDSAIPCPGRPRRSFSHSGPTSKSRP